MPLGIDKHSCSHKFVLGNNDRGSLILLWPHHKFDPLIRRGACSKPPWQGLACNGKRTKHVCTPASTGCQPNANSAASDGMAPTSQFPIAPCAYGAMSSSTKTDLAANTQQHTQGASSPLSPSESDGTCICKPPVCAAATLSLSKLRLSK